MNINKLMNRVITGGIIWIGWLLLLFFGSKPLFLLIIGVLVAIALNEFYNMMCNNNIAGQRQAFILLGLLPVAAAYTGNPALLIVGLLGALILLYGLVLNSHHLYNQIKENNSIDFLLRSTFGIIFVGFFSAHLIMLRAIDDGSSWLLVLTAITIASDIGAYFTGKSMGKRKLCPHVSPGKTFEGFCGGLFFGIIAGMTAAFVLFPAVSSFTTLLISMALCCLGVIGDLVESILKRSSGVKDSGTLLPGHGGILDRSDSLLVTAPVLFYLLQFDIII